MKGLAKKSVVNLQLKEALLQFQADLAKLQVLFKLASANRKKFVQINQTGFRKILKKWDKREKSLTKEIYLSRQVEIQPVFNTDVLTKLQ